MNQIAVSRAIGAEFVRRKYRSFVLTFTLVAAILLALVTWLITINAWWWLLAAPLIGCIILGFVALAAVRVIIGLISPTITKVQGVAVKDFVDKLERVADNLQTPPFIIVFRVVRDIVWPREPAYIKTVVSDSSTLHSDYAALARVFSEK